MNPLSDIFNFLRADTNDFNALGGWKYLLLAIFYALMIAGAAIAIANWKADRSQRTVQHLGMWGTRVLIGCMWYEAMLWKLPFSTENGLHYWTQQMAGRAAFQIHRDLVTNLLLPNFALINPVIFLAELGFASSMILGFGVRLVSAGAILFVLNLWLGIYINRGGDPAEWSWSYIFLALLHLLFILYAAGRSLGVDAMLRRSGVLSLEKQGLVARMARVAT